MSFCLVSRLEFLVFELFCILDFSSFVFVLIDFYVRLCYRDLYYICFFVGVEF